MKGLKFIQNLFKPRAQKVLSKTLFEQERPEISISIIMRIRDDGALEFAGQDLGRLVQELQGKSDYEYYLLIPFEEKEKLILKLSEEQYAVQNDVELFDFFLRNYANNEAFSEITKLLERLEIRYNASYW